MRLLSDKGVSLWKFRAEIFFAFQLRTGSATALGGLIGSGVNLGPVVARAQELRIKGAKVTPSVCPYCSVGCGTLIHTIDGKIVNIEGDPRSPHNEGTLCPKGAAIFQLHVNPNRPTRCCIAPRAPPTGKSGISSAPWTASPSWSKRPATRPSSKSLPTASSSTSRPPSSRLGGATLEIEWNHLQQKLMRGLGIVAIENQARI